MYAGCWLRYPRTTQEARMNCRPRFSQDPEDSLVKSKRNRHNLPNAYDDLFIPRSKSWKDNRRPKYRLKKM